MPQASHHGMLSFSFNAWVCILHFQHYLHKFANQLHYQGQNVDLIRKNPLECTYQQGHFFIGVLCTPTTVHSAEKSVIPTVLRKD